MNIEALLNDIQERRAGDAARFAALDRDECMLCRAYGADKRSLYVECLYAVNEMVPEAIDLYAVEAMPSGFYLLICKSCRADFLGMMREWRDRRVARRGLPMDHDGGDLFVEDERNIPVRENGTVVMLTREEWDARQ